MRVNNKSYEANVLTSRDNGFDGEWTSWNNLTGENVLKFIKSHLEDAVVDLEYNDLKLQGLNAFGKVVAETNVTVATPTYTLSEVTISQLKINGRVITANTIDINASSELSGEITFNWKLSLEIGGNINETSTAPVRYKIYCFDVNTQAPANLNEIEGTTGWKNEGVTVDIKSLFDGVKSSELQIKVELSFSYKDTTEAIIELKGEYKHFSILNIKKITLTSISNGLITSKLLTFNIDNDGASLSGYRLHYRIGTGSSYVSRYLALDTDNTVSISLDDIIGSNKVYEVQCAARVVNNSETLYSDWISVSSLYQELDYKAAQGAAVIISGIPSKINNCDSSNLFSLTTTNQLSGQITVYTFKASSPSDISNITVDPKNANYFRNAKMWNYIFKTTSFNLSITDESKPLHFYNYIEIPKLTGNNNKIYLVFVIVNGTTETIYKTVENEGRVKTVNEITVINPKNYEEFLHTTGAIIDYSQISSTNKFQLDSKTITLFEESNLNAGLSSSDGFVQDGKYTGFTVSPLGYERLSNQTDPYPLGYGEDNKVDELGYAIRPINLFNTPIKLTSDGTTYLTNKEQFSIELLVKTSNVNDSKDFLLEMGNIRMYPDSIKVWNSSLGIGNDGELDLSDYFVASEANFSLDEITHILITYDTNYKPSTYEKIYDELYPNYTSSASSYPCLKIYINGEINRSVSISRDAIARNGQFKLQIHPSAANLTLYGFRTYSKCLTQKEIKANWLSSIATLGTVNINTNKYEADSKNAKLLVNDIIYDENDYTPSTWNTLKTEGLANTISIRKCLNIKDPRYNQNGNTKTFEKKNILVFVTGDEGPLYYGNKKHIDKNKISIKGSDATVFIKYAEHPEYDGKFIGQYLFHEHGYDEYYKGQGTSAKKYGGAYNTQLSKFIYINDSKETLFLDLIKGNFYDPDYKSSEHDNKIIISNGDGTYSTNVQFDFKDETYRREIITEKGEQKYEKSDEDRAAVDRNNILKELFQDYFELPTEGTVTGKEKSKCTKLVGKVNYASSMQSHKQGACDLYAENYPNREGDYMIRRAVKEDVFYYFYIKLSDIFPDLENQAEIDEAYRKVQWSDIEKKLDNVKFFGFQTWGSAKMDPSTFGMDKKKDLEYLVVEGADNKNACTNFKSPWASMQVWTENQATGNSSPYYAAIGHETDPSKYIHQFSGKDSSGNPDYLTGIMINDETVMYKKPSSGTEGELQVGEEAVAKGPDAWDIAGNVLKELDKEKAYTLKAYNGEVYAKNTWNTFAEFSNLIYTFDFGNLELLPSECGELRINNPLNYNGLLKKVDTSKKYVVTSEKNGFEVDNTKTLNVKIGDVLRWDQLFETFVPAGLYYNAPNNWDNDITDSNRYDITKWETFNLFDIYNAACEAYNGRNSIFLNLVNKAKANLQSYKDSELDVNNIFTSNGVELFTMSGINPRYLNNSINDSDLSGEDNRAATFTTIKGAFADMFKCVIWAFCDVNSFTYHQAAIRFLSGTDNRAKNIYFVIKGNSYNSTKVDGKTTYTLNNSQNFSNRNLITLFLDDLDTIFATDNNGQLSKDYNLVEPIYNNETISNWGDSRSALWYNFDLLFENQIQYHLKRIIDWAIDGGEIINTNNKLYKTFLNIQDQVIPAVGYNHTSEIYYDVMQTVFKGGSLQDWIKSSGLFSKFNNNLVKNPESLVHGGCFESEKQFLKKRIAMLASYATTFSSLEDQNQTIKMRPNSAGGQTSLVELQIEEVSFIQDFYPDFNGKRIEDIKRSYADPFTLSYNNKEDLESNTNIRYPNLPKYLTQLARVGSSYEFPSVTLTSDLNSVATISHTDYFKTITFNKGVANVDRLQLKNASEIRYKVPLSKDPEYPGQEQNMYEVEKGMSFNDSEAIGNTLDMSKFIKNVEILDAPWTKILKKDNVDFSKCTRLVELNLTRMTKNINENVDTILLPKSNKLKKVILPSTVKNLVVEYYPSITNFEGTDCYFKFDDSSVNIEVLSIDWRNSWAEKFIQKYVNTNSIKNLILNNVPEAIELDYSTLDILSSLEKFNFANSVTITLRDNMDLKLKGKLAAKFGNIDSTASTLKVKVLYNIINATRIELSDSITLVQGTGYPFDFDLVNDSGVPANNVNISNNRLDIIYIVDLSKAEYLGKISCVRETGIITIASDVKLSSLSNTTFIIQAQTSTGQIQSESATMSFGVYKPKVGDIVYSDGTYADKYNPRKTPIGFVFWRAELTSDIPNTTKYDYRILSFNSLPSERFGPANYDADNTSLNYYGLNARTLAFIKEIYTTSLEYKFGYVLDEDFNSQNPLKGRPVSSLTYNFEVLPRTSPISKNSSVPINSEYNLYCGEYVTNAAYNYVSGTGLITKVMDKRPGATKEIDKIDDTNIDKAISFINYVVGDGAGVLAFPAYFKTRIYVPENVDENNEEIGKHHWYIPSANEYSYLILQKIKMINSSSTSEKILAEDWNKSYNSFFDNSTLKIKSGTGSVIETLLKNYKINTLLDYNEKIGNSIKFFNYLDVIKSGTFTPESTDSSNNTYIYSAYNDGNNTDIGWKINPGYWAYQATVMSASAVVYPCCRVIKTFLN